MAHALSSPSKSRLDEHSFQQLLAAAFVIQEHNRARPQPPPVAVSHYAETAAAVAALQVKIAPGEIDLPASARLIAERALLITSADGVGVGIVVDDSFTYIGVAGIAVVDAGARFSVPESLSGDCVLQKKTLEAPNLATDMRIPRALVSRNRVGSLIAAPVIQKGAVLGVFELRFTAPKVFSADDTRAAELFAGLVNLAIVTAAKKHVQGNGGIAREAEAPAPIIQPATAPEAIAPVAAAAGSDLSARAEPEWQPLAETASGNDAEADPVYEARCARCGKLLRPNEFFCGSCGTAYDADDNAPPAEEPATNAESHIAESHIAESHIADPHIADTHIAESPAPDPPPFAPEPLDSIFDRLQPSQEDSLYTDRGLVAEDSPAVRHDLLDLHAAPGHDLTAFKDADPLLRAPGDASALVASSALGGEPAASDSALEGLIRTEQVQPWGSAQKALGWLEGIREQQRPALSRWRALWETHRANIWLGAAVVILLIAIVQLSLAPAVPHAASSNQPSAPQLTFFESLLVSLGMAEAPSPPVYLGNPDARVWVDVRTALYYCAIAPQFGKTPGGKFTTQRDAQQDQFEPAHRKVCP